MVSKLSKFKRSFPFLLALVVLISCLPVIPASADEIYWLDGSWEFKSDISWDSDFDFFYPSFVTIDGSFFDAFNYICSDSELWLYSQDEDACVYDSGFWNGPLPVVLFSERVQVTKDEYDFFQLNLTQVFSPSATYSTTLNIDGQKFIFTSSTETPAVLLQVTSSGAILSYGDQTLYYIYPGSHIFLGLGASPSAAVFVPGGTYPLAAGDHVLYSVSRHVIDPDHPPTTDPFTATIVIDGLSFVFSGGDSYPVVRLGVGSSKVAFGLGDTVVNYWYPTPLGGQTFLGFSTSSDCLVVDYPVNEIDHPSFPDPIIEFCDISFSQSNSVLTLYPVYSYSPSGGSGGSGSGSVDDPAGVGTILSRFAQFLVSPLMVFFNAEFIPGFSFGKLALVAFCFGLVFWLLRVSS